MEKEKLFRECCHEMKFPWELCSHASISKQPYYLETIEKTRRDIKKQESDKEKA